MQWQTTSGLSNRVTTLSLVTGGGVGVDDLLLNIGGIVNTFSR